MNPDKFQPGLPDGPVLWLQMDKMQPYEIVKENPEDV